MEVRLSNIRRIFIDNILPVAFLTIFLSFGLIGGCGGSGGSGGTVSSNTGFGFTDVTSQSGLSYTHGFLSGGPSGEMQLISGGVAAGDYDEDGWVDLYIVKGNDGSNMLFRNQGNGTFVNVANLAGVALSGVISSGPIFADFSGDGYLDLFVGAIFPHKVSLFINNGNGTFTNITYMELESAINSEFTFSAAFGDYDLDNDLDLYMTH